MNRLEWIELLTTGGKSPHIKGVIYSHEEVENILKGNRNNITAVTYTKDDENQVEFFTNNHILGYPFLGDDFCPCSMSTPITAVPRPGCEDGVLDSVDKYNAVFNRTRHIWSMDELIDFLATIGMVEGEGLNV